jgi:hypothetical protein
MKTKILSLSMLLLIMLAACKKEQTVTPDDHNPVENMEQLEVSPSFDWSTEDTPTLTVRAYTRGLLVVKGSNNAIYHRSYVQKRTWEEIVLTIPTYETKVILEFKGMTTTLSTGSNNLQYEFVK